MSYIIPELLHQLEPFHNDEKKVTKLLIIHAHFDHVGIIPFFKRHHPDMEIYASQRCWEILKMERAIHTINEFSSSSTVISLWRNLRSMKSIT